MWGVRERQEWQEERSGRQCEHGRWVLVIRRPRESAMLPGGFVNLPSVSS